VTKNKKKEETVKKTLTIVLTMVVLLSANIAIADTISIEEVKKITTESSENIKNEKVISVILKPGDKLFKRYKGWTVFATAAERNENGELIYADRNANTIYAEYEKIKPPIPSLNIKPLNKLANKGKPNYSFVKSYIVQRPDIPEEYFAIVASKNEMMVYIKDKHTYFANLEPLDIKISPTLFISFNEQEKYINILVVDEDEVKNLHTGTPKIAKFTFNPAKMTMSAKGSINEEKQLYVWKGKREE
jgi:hypothetical protein